jgi:hypothetical protein
VPTGSVGEDLVGEVHDTGLAATAKGTGRGQVPTSGVGVDQGVGLKTGPLIDPTGDI